MELKLVHQWQTQGHALEARKNSQCRDSVLGYTRGLLSVYVTRQVLIPDPVLEEPHELASHSQTGLPVQPS